MSAVLNHVTDLLDGAHTDPVVGPNAMRWKPGRTPCAEFAGTARGWCQAPAAETVNGVPLCAEHAETRRAHLEDA